jgi:hypothetical protein
MSAILLTANNIKFCKERILGVSPLMKSSHVTEVIAQGAGYDSNAALIADTKNIQIPRLKYIDFDAMHSRCQDFGHKIVFESILTQDTLVSLPDPILGVYKENCLRSNNYWYQECQRRKIPMVYLHPRPKLWSVHWDDLNLNRQLYRAPKFQEKPDLVHLLFRRFQEIAKKSPRGSAHFEGSISVGEITRIERDQAFEFANELFSVIYSEVCKPNEWE